MSNVNGNTVIAERVIDYSRESPTVTELPKLPRPINFAVPITAAPSQLSSRRPSTNPSMISMPLGTSAFSNSSATSRKPLAGLFDGGAGIQQPPSETTLQKVALAKLAVEEKYEHIWDKRVSPKVCKVQNIQNSLEIL